MEVRIAFILLHLNTASYFPKLSQEYDLTKLFAFN